MPLPLLRWPSFFAGPVRPSGAATSKGEMMRIQCTVLLAICFCAVFVGCAKQITPPKPLDAASSTPQAEIQEPPGIPFGQTAHPDSPLAAPAGVTASQGIAVGEILINWDEDPDTEKYVIYMLNEKSNTWQGMGQVNRPPAIISDIRTGEEYFYAVAGVGRDGRQGPWSTVVMGWAASENQPPANVRASRGTNQETILLTWDSVPGAMGYKIYMSSGSDRYDYLRDWQGTSVRIPVTDQKKPYRFKVSSISANKGESVLSDFSVGWTAASAEPYPDAPTGLSASDGAGNGEIFLKWDKVEKASRYEIHRSPSSIGPFEPLAMVTTTSYTDRGVTPWTGFWYKVAAVDPAGMEGDFCNHDGGWSRQHRN